MTIKEYHLFWKNNSTKNALNVISDNLEGINSAIHEGATELSLMSYENSPADNTWPYIKGDWYVSLDCKDYPELAREEAIEFTKFLKEMYSLPEEAFTYWVNGNKGIQIKILSKVFGKDNSCTFLPIIYQHITQDIVRNLRLLTIDWSIYKINEIAFTRAESASYADGTYRSQITEDALFRSTFSNLIERKQPQIYICKKLPPYSPKLGGLFEKIKNEIQISSAMNKGTPTDPLRQDNKNSIFSLNPKAIRYLFEDCSFIANCTKCTTPLEIDKQEAFVSIFSKFGSTGRDFIQKYSRNFEGRNAYRDAESIIASFDCKSAYSCKKIKKKWPCGKACGVNHPTELAHERTPPPYPDLIFRTKPPEDYHSLLPKELKKFVSHISSFYKSSWELVLTSSLTAISIAAQGRFVVELPDKTTHHLCIYTVINSSNTDTDARIISFFRNFFDQYEDELSKQYKQLSSERNLNHRSQNKILREKYRLAAQVSDVPSQKALLQEIKQLEKMLPPPVYEKKIITDDITPKAFIKSLERNDGKIGIMDPEGCFFESLTGHSLENIKRLSLLLMPFTKESHAAFFSKRRNTPYINILSVANRELIRHIVRSRPLNKRGIISCFLYVNQPEELTPSSFFDPKEICLDLCNWYSSKINTILKYSPPNIDIQGQPIKLKMANDAIGCFYNHCSYIDIFRKELPSFLRSWINRIHILTAKLSGILHLAVSNNPGDEYISKDTMEKACYLTVFFIKQTSSMICSIGSDPKTECAKEIYSWIRKKKSYIFYAREALRNVRSRYPTMEAVRGGLNYLEDHRVIYRVEPADQRGPGAKPGALYRVHPEAIKAIDQESQIYEIKFSG